MSTQSHKLIEARAALAAEADGLLNSADATAADLDRVETIHSEIADLDARIAKLEAVEARAAEIAEARAAAPAPAFGGAVVKREERTYTEHGSRSFFRDLFLSSRGDRAAADRLHRHAQENAIETRTTPNTTDGQGGEFVPPVWALDQWAAYARAKRVTANLTNNMALPQGTDQINIPKLTLGTQVGSQNGQNTSLTKRDFTTSTVSGQVQTIAGYSDTSVQLIEQSPLAGGLDRLILGDLMADYALQLNTQVVNGSGSSGQLTGFLNVSGINAVTYTSASPTGAGMMTPIAQAISQIVKNRYDAPEGIVMHPSTWYWLVASVDGNTRPLVVPTAGGPFNANGTVTAPGASDGLVGTIHGVPVYLDATVPTNIGTGTNQAPVLAAKFSDTYLFEGGMKTGVFPDVNSASLGIRFRLHGYVAIAHRYPTAISAVTGTGTIVQSGF